MGKRMLYRCKILQGTKIYLVWRNFSGKNGEIREIEGKIYVINDFNAIKIISISKVNQAWANACSFDVKYCKEPKYIKFE